VVAAVVVAFTAFSYAELSTRYPVSAGEAAYVEAGFSSSILATVVGLAVVLSGLVSAAAVSLGAASYLHGLTGASTLGLTVAVVALMALIAMWGITQSVTVAAIITVIEVSGLLMVMLWGFAFSEPSGVTLADILPPLTGPHWAGIGAASLLAFFAFVGFEDMANVAEEVKDPLHTMPRAILWTLLLATMLYIGTTTAVLMAVPLATLSDSAAPLLLVFADAPEGLQHGFSLVAIVATVNGVLIQMIMASRVLYGLADRGHLPKAMSYVSPKTQTPVVSTLVVAATILVLALSFPIDALAERTSQVVLFVFVLVNLALIRIKLAGVSAERHFRVPIIVPVLGVATSVLLLATGLL
jgi:amino acid transporter